MICTVSRNWISLTKAQYSNNHGKNNKMGGINFNSGKLQFDPNTIHTNKKNTNGMGPSGIHPNGSNKLDGTNPIEKKKPNVK